MEEAEANPGTVGARIATARKDAGLTQDELADLVGVKMRQIQNYEAGTSDPYRKIAKIAEVTGTSVGWLRHGDTAPATDPEDLGRRLEGVEAGLAELSVLLRRSLEPQAAPESPPAPARKRPPRKKKAS